MPIIETCSTRDEAEARIAALLAEGIPAGNIRDISNAYRPTVDGTYWTAEKAAAFTLFAFDTYIGLCLKDYERNGYDDSDFMMTVWNEKESKPFDFCFATTRGWTYPSYGSSPDASAEIRAKYDAYMAKIEEAYRQRRELEELMTPAIGKRLEVTKGRKVPIGTVGTCIWTGERKYSPSKWAAVSLRVGIRTEDGSVYWTDSKNVQVV